METKSNKRRSGVPERVYTPMDSDLLARVDEFRFAQRLESRAEAMRQLIEAGLVAKAGDKGERQ